MGMAAANSSNNRWLFGPVRDLVFGCGLLYAALVPIYAFWGTEIRQAQPGFLMALLVIAFSMPHYGATLLRVYEQRRERRRYALFAVHSTLAILALSVFGLYDSFVGSLLTTVYLTWSPWHYTGQNYGIAVMFLRRRGLNPTPAAKRLLYGSFFFSFLTALLVMHSGSEFGYGFAQFDGGDVRFLPLGWSTSLVLFAAPLSSALSIACLIAASVLLARVGRLRDLIPTWTLALTQALWFSVPFLLAFYGRDTGIGPLDAQSTSVPDFQIWIWVSHGIQYIWITTFYARAEKSWRSYGSYFGKILLAGSAIWTLPAILFAPAALGVRSYDAGLALVIASAVNIHHFILDGAIWKLRRSRVAAVLIRDSHAEATTAEPEEDSRARNRWLRRVVWGTTVAGLLSTAFVFEQRQFAYRGARNRGDIAATDRILDRLAWFGRDDEDWRLALGATAERQRDFAMALSQYEKSLALRPSVEVLEKVGWVGMRTREWREAAKAYDKILAIDPNHADALLGGGIARLKLSESESARALLERAAKLRPDHETTRQALAEANEQLAAETSEDG